MPRTIVHFPEILLPDPKDMGPVQPVTQLEQKREYGSIRPVMIVRFGFKSNGQTTFHHCILIGDTQKIVNGERDIDNGKLFDWGSMPDTATSNKFKEPCRVKAFDLSLAHSSRNEYDHRGYTARSDKEIEELMNTYGKRYNVFTNNCRDVCAKVAVDLIDKQYGWTERGGFNWKIWEGLF